MTITLLHKIFAAFMVTSLIIVVVFSLVTHYLGMRNFSDYVNLVALDEASRLIPNLVTAYGEHENNWDWLKNEHEMWTRIINSALGPLENRRTQNSQRMEESSETFKNDHNGPPHHMRGPFAGPLGEQRRQGNQHLFQRDPLRLRPRLSLLDANLRIVVGYPFPQDELLLREIVMNESPIGYLALHKETNVSTTLDLNFIKDQQRAYLIIGFIIFVFSTLLSFLVSSHFLGPLKLLKEGTDSLASLKFDTRIPINRRDEFGKLATAFNTMAGKIEEYESMRKQWVSDVSHELRTPLSVLRGEIEAMQDGIRPLNTNNLNSLHTEVLFLNKIVDDLHLLSLSDSENLQITLKPLDIIPVLRETCRRFELRFAQSRLTLIDQLVHDTKNIILADHDAVVQVFTNILENANRYVQPPGTVTTTNHFSTETIQLIFDDSGPGVPDETLNRLFDRLFTVDSSRNKKKSGSGLGLAIARSIVHAHKGSIHAEKNTIGGLRITIELPLYRPSP